MLSLKIKVLTMVQNILIAGAAVVGGLLFVAKRAKQSGSKSKAKDKNAIPVAWPALIASSGILRDVKTSTIPLTTAKERSDNARRIFKAFKKEGYSDGVSLAAVVNADYESRLSNKAVGDSGKSVGLFQVHSKHGLSVKDRMKPDVNIKFILGDMAKNGMTVVDMDEDGASVAALSGRFAHDVERPSDRTASLVSRASHAKKLFPMVADLGSSKFEIIGA